MVALAERRLLAVPLAMLIAASFGVLVALSPLAALGLVGAGAIALLAVAAPVTHLTLLVFMTLIVPYSIQNQIGVGGGTGAAGLVFSDILLLTGLARALLVLARRPLRGVEAAGLLLSLAYLGLAFAQLLHGALGEGHPVNEAGNDFRSLLGFGAIIVALPIVLDESMHQRLLRAMFVIGALLGLWGLIQWTVDLPYTASGGFGVREGVRLTSDGKGQLQGGLYGFPVAVALGYAALLSGQIQSRGTRLALIAVTAVNGICLILTFERTFIVITVFACAFITLRAGHIQRLRAIILAPLALIAVIVPLGIASPESLTTARERLMSIGQYGDDASVRYRVRESQQTLDEISAHPWQGSGLGASIWWGRPEAQVPPSVNYFIHNGYLWHAWKLGIPLALFLILGIVVATLRGGRPRGSPMFAAVAVGGQAALLALLVTSITFPAITARPITPTLGILLALCLVPRVVPSPSRA